MRLHSYIIPVAIASSLIFTSCADENLDTTTVSTDSSNTEVAEGFTFATSQVVELTIIDNESSVRYNVYYNDSENDVLLNSSFGTGENVSMSLNLPSHVEEITIVKEGLNVSSSQVVAISSSNCLLYTSDAADD